MIPRTREFRNGGFVLRVDVLQKRNNTQEVKIIEEYFIDQTFVAQFANVKALLLAIKTNKKGHDQEYQDTGI